MVPAGSTVHPYLYSPSSSLTLKYQHGLRCQARLWASALSLVESGAMDVNTEPDHSRATDTDATLSSILGLDLTMVPGAAQTYKLV